jgi:hypothetical protein
VPGLIPAGRLVIFDGDPGQGKSFLTLDLAAAVTRGDRITAEGAKTRRPVAPIPMGEAQRRALRYLEKCPPAVAGRGGHARTFNVACKLVKGFGLEEGAAYQMLASFYIPKCEPPWIEAELRHMIADAARAPGPVGYLFFAPRGPL